MFLASVGALGLSGCGRLEDSGQPSTTPTTKTTPSTPETTTRASFPTHHPSYIDDRISFINCYISATKASAAAFERAADYGDEEKSDRRREVEDEGREALEACEGASELL